MPELSDVELMVLAWRNGGARGLPSPSSPSLPPLPSLSSRAEQLHKQLDLTTVRQEVGDLQQEIAQQHTNIDRLRRQLPRGWYRRSNSTLDLDIRPLADA